jgi:hypothetical protein
MYGSFFLVLWLRVTIASLYFWESRDGVKKVTKSELQGHVMFFAAFSWRQIGLMYTPSVREYQYLLLDDKYEIINKS